MESAIRASRSASSLLAIASTSTPIGSSEILYGAGIGSGESDPCFLYRVVGLAPRAQHSIRDRPQMSSAGLEALHQNFFFAHRSHSSGSFRHRVMGMTNAPNPM
jgi:hypothetical protein